MDKFQGENEIHMWDFETWGMNYVEGGGGDGHEWLLEFLEYDNWKKGCTRKYHIWCPKKTLDQTYFTWKMSKILVWSIRWEQLDSWAPPQILVQKWAAHNKLPTLHLEYVNYPI